jgi:uncharacterized protein
MAENFIGHGWRYPLGTDASGSIALTSDERDLEQAMRLILTTAPGERPMRPEFGCGIHDQIFSPMDATTAGRVSYDVRAALERWEPRINVTAIDVTYGEGRQGVMYVDITYTERETNDRRNLVFPFYIIPEEQDNAALQNHAVTEAQVH